MVSLLREVSRDAQHLCPEQHNTGGFQCRRRQWSSVVEMWWGHSRGVVRKEGCRISGIRVKREWENCAGGFLTEENELLSDVCNTTWGGRVSVHCLLGAPTLTVSTGLPSGAEPERAGTGSWSYACWESVIYMLENQETSCVSQGFYCYETLTKERIL